MENKSRIGSTLIICGAACIVAALVFAGFLANALSNPDYSPGDRRGRGGRRREAQGCCLVVRGVAGRHRPLSPSSNESRRQA